MSVEELQADGLAGEAVRGLQFISPMPRLKSDGEEWVSELRRIESLGFDTVAVSHHVTKGWQLGLVAAMAFAAASTSRLRVLSLVAQNPLQHPALLAKDIATIDRLSGGRVELGIGAGWLADDYDALGLTAEAGLQRFARLKESLEIIEQYFTRDTVNFAGMHYQINGMEALPVPVQRPRPPILVGAGGPRTLELAGRVADIVGIHARMRTGTIDGTTVRELTADSIQAKIDRVRTAARLAKRPVPRLQFSCYHVHVTDAAVGPTQRSTWADVLESEKALLKESPAVLIGTASECAGRIAEWSERFGITYWHLGADPESASLIIDKLR